MHFSLSIIEVDLSLVGRQLEETSPKTDVLLWDTMTNVFTNGPDIPGLENFNMFRPTIGRVGEQSIILAGTRLQSPSGREYLQDIWIYNFNEGWTRLMENSPDHLASVEQVGIYMLSNPDLSQYDTLLTCKE